MEQTKAKILVVEDEDMARNNLEHILKKEGYDVVAVDNGKKALEHLMSTNFDLVITDFKMKKVDGMAVLEKSRRLQPYTEVVMITGYATVDSAVKAMKEGAYYYIAKPYKIDEVRKVAQEALLKRRLQMENLALKDSLKKAGQIPYVVGKSEAIQAVLETVKQIAPSDTNVLLLGESGTGKELVAKAIHRLSTRSGKRFVAFNCGSFTEELMANELFGHEKGSFTGAATDKTGLLKIADGGTVFLDEVGDMPVTMQIKLLRVIQEKEFLRVGGTSSIPVDVRFIAATHRDLQDDMEKGFFRQDLYYRLNVISLHLPPLVDRKGDIPLLAYHFLAEKNQTMKKNIREIDREAMDLLCHYSWPGNVRELENVIERAVALANGPSIHATDLPEHIRNLSIETYRQSSSAVPTLEEQEKRYIRWVLEKSDGNRTQAAKIMGIDRVSLWRKLKRYEME
jgi:two-component system, NtrC family, response regulator HydG